MARLSKFRFPASRSSNQVSTLWLIVAPGKLVEVDNSGFELNDPTRRVAALDWSPWMVLWSRDGRVYDRLKDSRFPDRPGCYEIGISGENPGTLHPAYVGKATRGRAAEGSRGRGIRKRLSEHVKTDDLVHVGGILWRDRGRDIVARSVVLEGADEPTRTETRLINSFPEGERHPWNEKRAGSD